MDVDDDAASLKATFSVAGCACAALVLSPGMAGCYVCITGAGCGCLHNPMIVVCGVQCLFMSLVSV